MASVGLLGRSCLGRTSCHTSPLSAPSTCYAPTGAVPRLHHRAFAPSVRREGGLRATSCVVVPVAGLKKERKRLTKVLKSHRKRLEALLPAVTVDAPEVVLSDLLGQIKLLTARLESGADQRHIDALLYRDDDSGSDSDDECTTMTAASCTRRRVDVTSRPAAPSPASSIVSQPAAASGSSMLVHGSNGRTIEVPLPDLDLDPPTPGWSPDDYAAMQFEGAGRVLVCQGGKCQRKGALEVLQAVSALAANSPGIEVLPCKCVGKCSEGAALRVRPEGQKCAVYTRVSPGQLPAMFEAHFTPPPPEQQHVDEPADKAGCCVECGQH